MWRNMQNLIDLLELFDELEELREVGLTEEEIAGYLDTFYDNWFDATGDKVLN